MYIAKQFCQGIRFAIVAMKSHYMFNYKVLVLNFGDGLYVAFLKYNSELKIVILQLL